MDFLSNLNLDKQVFNEAYGFLKEVNLEDKSDFLVPSLSHGEKKVRDMVALSMNPKLFLFDEPMAGLDGNSSKLIIDLLKKLKRELQYC